MASTLLLGRELATAKIKLVFQSPQSFAIAWTEGGVPADLTGIVATIALDDGTTWTAAVAGDMTTWTLAAGDVDFLNRKVGYLRLDDVTAFRVEVEVQA